MRTIAASCCKRSSGTSTPTTPISARSNPAADPPTFTPTQFYDAMTAWVENGVVPERLVLSTAPGGPVKTRPICVYPEKATHTGGDPKLAASYSCS